VVRHISDVLRSKASSGVVTLRPEASVADLVAALAEHRIGAAVVSEDARTALGIVSERDVVRRLADGATANLLARPVSELMTSEVVTCTGDSSIDEVMAIMTDRRIRHLPVLLDGQMVGLVSIGDVVRANMDDLRHERDQLTAYITG
jgi:CBS domain-containing protein